MADKQENRDYWNMPLETLTASQIDEHERQCWDRTNAISNERSRRAALPYIWASETQIITQLRATFGGAPEDGAKWNKPENVIGAYLADDTVTHEGVAYVAVGRGAIMTAPGTPDPVQGEVWQPVDTDTTADSAA